MKLTPLTCRRLRNFRANRRGYWSLWAFLALFGLSLVADVIANDRPLLVRYDGGFYIPVFRSYPETAFGGILATEAFYVGALGSRRNQEKRRARLLEAGVPEAEL